MEINEIRKYCLNCKLKPCSNKGCPLHNNIPEFIHEEDEKKAFYILSKTTVLPAVCSRICQSAKQCKGSCVRGIKGESVSINEMEKYLADNAISKGYKLPKNKEEKREIETPRKKVAIIGGGPSGLTAAAFLAMENIDVTIFEKNSKLGGLLEYGIPDFRLNRNVVKNTIDKIIELGITAKTNITVRKRHLSTKNNR